MSQSRELLLALMDCDVDPDGASEDALIDAKAAEADLRAQLGDERYEVELATYQRHVARIVARLKSVEAILKMGVGEVAES